ncbi:UDP-glucose/GDP-mannose dehydrogenase family protein [Candidatus Woesearchaeota archaeon]|nr:UDP-glucose/GDP-mannose dehydrogenase family protein [Candidatus Woesearchaeota archaeon]
MNISVYGAGFVGLTAAACLANIGHQIICIDSDNHKINLLKTGKIPFYEPGLQELTSLNAAKGRLTFSTDGIAGANAEVIFNCVGTPPKENHSADLKFVFQVVDIIAKHSKNYSVLVNKSTVPPGTARMCQEKLLATPVEVVSNPEFLKEGCAVYDFTHPDKIVIGSSSDKAKKTVREMYAGFERSYLKIFETNWETAELIKYANNAFLATKISFINEIANICERVGGDIKDLSTAIGMDYRIGSKFLHAGLGYGGSCFPKDIKALIHTANDCGYEASLLKAVNTINERQKLVIVDKIKKTFPSLADKVFTIWGLAYKPKTSDIREAVSQVMISKLISLGAKIKVYDPIALEEAKLVLGKKVTYCGSLQESLIGSNGLIIATEWDEFRGADLPEMAKIMNEKFIFDGRNIYDPKIAAEAGFKYYGIGRR